MTTLAPTLLLGLVLSTPAPAKAFPPFSLENFDGRELGSRSLEGKTTIVVPTYAKCIFACPLVTLFLAQLDEELGSPDDVQYLHVSVNPEDDTAEEIRLHFEKHELDAEADPRWLFANGTPDAIDALLRDIGVVVTRTRVEEGILTEHTVRVIVVGSAGDTLATFDTYFWDKEAMRDAIEHETN